MGKNRWASYGYDKARVNIHIMKMTGKYGKLDTPEEVWNYMQNMNQEPLRNPDNAEKRQTERPCAVKSGRLVAVKDGTANIYRVDAEGRAGELLEAKNVETKASGRAWRCVDCKNQFATWADFCSHSLDAKAAFDTANKSHDTINESARDASPDDENRSNPTLAAADPNYETTPPPETATTTDNRRDPSNRPGVLFEQPSRSEQIEGPSDPNSADPNAEAGRGAEAEAGSPAGDQAAARNQDPGNPTEGPGDTEARPDNRTEGRRTAGKSREETPGPDSAGL